MATSLHQRARQVLHLAAKEWRLLARNPHGLAVLFLMPAIFVLVMSFTLKNSLVAPVDLPTTGWVVEAKEAAAAATAHPREAAERASESDIPVTQSDEGSVHRMRYTAPGSWSAFNSAIRSDTRDGVL